MGNEKLDRYLPQIYRFAVYMLRDHHVAQDITQETMLRAVNRKKQFTDMQDPKAWLLQVASNLCKDYLRKKKAKIHNTMTLLDEPLGGQPEPWFRMLQHESCEALEQTIEGLTERERSVLYLSAFEDLENREIAAVLELSEGSVKVALSRARKSVRKSILQQREKENQQ